MIKILLGALTGSVALLTCSYIVDGIKLMFLYYINEYTILQANTKLIIHIVMPIVGICMLYVIVNTNLWVKPL